MLVDDVKHVAEAYFGPVVRHKSTQKPLTPHPLPALSLSFLHSEAGDPSLHGAVGELVVEGGGGTRDWSSWLIGAGIRISLSDVKLVVKGGAVGLEVERSLDLRSELGSAIEASPDPDSTGNYIRPRSELVVDRSLDPDLSLRRARAPRTVGFAVMVGLWVVYGGLWWICGGGIAGFAVMMGLWVVYGGFAVVCGGGIVGFAVMVGLWVVYGGLWWISGGLRWWDCGF
uniref:Uncharacterized protein n=1 Tax=Fagus sylvatica TaxID=28930 RepID=A0A2N9J1R7_FAGSY